MVWSPIFYLYCLDFSLFDLLEWSLFVDSRYEGLSDMTPCIPISWRGELLTTYVDLLPLYKLVEGELKWEGVKDVKGD